jgi:hypothetical protein
MDSQHRSREHPNFRPVEPEVALETFRAWAAKVLAGGQADQDLYLVDARPLFRKWQER